MPTYYPQNIAQEAYNNAVKIGKLRDSVKAAKSGLKNLKLRYYKAGEASKAASKAATAVKAGKTISAGAGLAVVAGAGALGAAAILREKRKLDREYQKYEAESNLHHNQLIKTIRSKRKK